MTELVLSLKILADGKVAVREAGAVKTAVGGIGPASAQAAAEATAAVNRIGAGLAGVGPEAAQAVKSVGGIGAATAGASAQATTATGRIVNGLGAINPAAQGATAAVRQISQVADTAAAGMARLNAAGLQSLKSLESQALATGRGLSAALGMSGVRDLSGEHAQAQAGLAAMEARTAAASARMAKLGTDATRAQAALDALGARGSAALAATGSSAAKATGEVDRAAGGLASGVKSMLGVMAGFEIVSKVLDFGRTAASIQDMETRLQGVTAKTGDYAGAEAYLVKLATEHHKSLSGLADGYTQLLALEENQIVTRKEAQAITAGLSNTQSALGASSSQLQQVMYGLGQALSSPVVHAEELNQVTEPLPGLLAKMDRAAGLSAGGFRALVNDGKVTAQFFKDTLVKALGDYDGAAARTGNNINAKLADMKREWELTAKAMEKPIAGAVGVVTGAAVASLRAVREGYTHAEQAAKDRETVAIQGWSREIPVQGKSVEKLLEMHDALVRLQADYGANTALAQRYAEQLHAVNTELDKANFRAPPSRPGATGRKTEQPKWAQGTDGYYVAPDASGANRSLPSTPAYDAALRAQTAGSGAAIPPPNQPLAAWDDKNRKFLGELKSSEQKAVDAVHEEIGKLRTMRDDVVSKLGEAKYNEIRAGLDQKLAQTVAKLNATGTQYDALFAKAQADHPNLPAGLVKAVVWKESTFNPNARNPESGAAGLAGFMPKTARQYGVENPYDPEQAIKGAGDYLDHLFGTVFKNDANRLVKTIAAYNTGEGNVQKYGLDLILSDRWGKGASKGETKDYVPKVLGRMADYGNPETASVDTGEYEKRRAEAEARFKAAIDHNAVELENAAKLIAAEQATALAKLDAAMADHAAQRAENVAGKTGPARQAAESRNAQLAAQDATEYARTRAEIEAKSFGQLGTDQVGRIQNLKAERDALAANLAPLADIRAADDRIATAETALKVLAEQRRQAEIKASTDIVAARNGEAAALKEAEAQARQTTLEGNQKAIADAQALASAQAQSINAQLNAGLLTQGQAQEKIRGIYAAQAQAIEGNVEALKKGAEAGGAENVLAAERAKAAWLDMLGAVRSPMDAMLAQWRDTTSQMEQASLFWAERTADALTGLVMTGKIDFADLSKSIIADIVKIEIEAHVVRPMIQGLRGAAGARPANAAAPGATGANPVDVIGQAGNWLSGLFSGPPATGVPAAAQFNAAFPAGPTTQLNPAYPASQLPAGAAQAPTISQQIGVPPTVAQQAGSLPQSPAPQAPTGAAANGTVGTFNQAMGGFGAGMFAAGIGQSLGMKGQSSTANTVAPMVGSAIGTGIGMALMPVLGPLGPILGGMLGGLMGSGSSMLFKTATPSAYASYDYRNGGVTESSSRRHAKGDLAGLEKIGGALGAPIGDMRAAMGIKLGDFSYGLAKSGKEGKEEFTIAGSAGGNEFFRTKVKAGETEQAIDRFMAALLKQPKSLKQFSDALERGAVATDATYSEIQKDIAKIRALRTFEGRRNATTDAIQQANSDAEGYRNAIMQFAPRKTRKAELAALDAALKMNVTDQLVQMTGAAVPLGDQLAKLKASFPELEAQAKKAGVSLDTVTAAETAAVKNLQDSIIAPALRDINNAALAALDAATPDTTQVARRTMNRLGGYISAGMDALANPNWKIGDNSAWSNILAQIDPGQHNGDLTTQITEIQGLVTQRYNLEISQIQATIQAAQQLRDVVANLKLSDLSPLGPAQRFATAQSAYQTDLAAYRGGNHDASLISRLGSEGQTYLSEAKNLYASAPQYNAVFDSVTSSLAGISASVGDGQKAIEDSWKETQGILKKLQERLDADAKKADATIKPSDLTTALTTAVGNLTKNADGNTRTVAKAIHDEGKASRAAVQKVSLLK